MSVDVSAEFLGKTDLGDKQSSGHMLKICQRSGGCLPVIYLVNKVLGFYPCEISMGMSLESYFHVPSVMAMLKREYAHNEANDLRNLTTVKNDETYIYARETLARVTEQVFLFVSLGCLTANLEFDKVEHDFKKMHQTSRSVRILFAPNAKQEAERLSEQLSKCVLKHIPNRVLHVICKKQCMLTLRAVTIKKPKISDLTLHYGEEFEKIHQKIISGLEKKDGSGIVLLHGEPGTGKTHYIRYLIQEIKDRKLVYIPPDMAADISTPEFLPFMLKQKGCILILDDAENIIKDRVEVGGGQKNQAMSNILNLSDGLLGDSMHMPIIATFNCEIGKIDSALLRNGRLIANHEFKKLPTDQAQRLSKELGFKSEISGAMTLADIYAQENE